VAFGGLEVLPKIGQVKTPLPLLWEDWFSCLTLQKEIPDIHPYPSISRAPGRPISAFCMRTNGQEEVILRDTWPSWTSHLSPKLMRKPWDNPQFRFRVSIHHPLGFHWQCWQIDPVKKLKWQIEKFTPFYSCKMIFPCYPVILMILGFGSSCSRKIHLRKFTN